MSVNDRIPLYQQIQDYIKQVIATENMKPGDRIPTEKELMDQFRVSKITVANALTGLANEKIISRVPGKGSFVAKGAETALAPFSGEPAARANEISEAVGLIGVIMPSIHDYFAIRLVEGIERALMNEGYRSMIILTHGKLEKEQEAIKELKSLGAEGLLIFPIDEENYNEEILGMKLAGFPFVLIDRYLPGVETHYIAADGRKGTRLAVEHLWELGHRNIAICSDSPLQTVTVQERIEGYIEALKDKGALINPAHMITDFKPLNELKDAEAHPLYRYIRNRMVTAYISLNGRLGVQIYQMARQAGLRVPEDVSIVSFDDPTSIVDEFSIFTHVKQFERDMGYRAAMKLLDVVRNREEVKHYSKMIIDPELVVRQTSGPVPNT
ncbi:MULTISPECIES: GntR family transcriptional regulator [Paenibacillus]|uniref:Transcriptional regulator, GntR family with LacI sensor n=2 Tax=Paenibacillus lactis TaxID=228574 RepID=G4HJN3_9BACL|nr:GntR family transcriptional regulator [Paenibacillus lactis]EHB62487.1 transcriptional regulator, GntR family with LacI sensor [Paenibacillus lactis 154]MBP1895906.1 GntR family transcriptional regulator of arabinose operon [Paenibacillus lactis]